MKKLHLVLTLFFILFMVNTSEAVPKVLKVSLHRDGNFRSIQDAVDAAPSHSSTKIIISIASGTYREKVVVPKDKTNLVFRGQGYKNTIVAWDDTAKSKGTTESATVAIKAINFTAYDISFKNTAPPPDGSGKDNAMAVAVNVQADQAAFYSCGFYSYQDTLLDNSGKHYYKDCFIQGATDFIFGNGRSLFEGCTLNVIAKERSTGPSGVITAQARTSLAEKTGFSFVRCKIVGSGNAMLGRAWRAYATVVFINTSMSDVVFSGGWDDYRNKKNDGTVFFAEYGSYGPGANSKERVSYSKQLKLSEASPFMTISYIQGEKWLPGSN